MAKKSTPAKAEKKIFESENIKLEFRPYDGKGMKGFATLIFYDAIYIYNCTVREKKDGELFVSMPSYKASNGEYYNYAYLDKDDELNEELNKLVNQIS